MSRLSLALASFVLSAMACLPAAAQYRPSLIQRVERALSERAAEWAVDRRAIDRDRLDRDPEDSFFQRFSESLEMSSPGQTAWVDLILWKDAGRARDTFKGQAVFQDNITAGRATKSTLPGLGDENHFWTPKDGLGHSVLHFRKNKLHVMIRATSADAAQKLARVIAEAAK